MNDRMCRLAAAAAAANCNTTYFLSQYEAGSPHWFKQFSQSDEFTLSMALHQVASPPLLILMDQQTRDKLCPSRSGLVLVTTVFGTTQHIEADVQLAIRIIESQGKTQNEVLCAFRTRIDLEIASILNKYL